MHNICCAFNDSRCCMHGRGQLCQAENKQRKQKVWKRKRKVKKLFNIFPKTTYNDITSFFYDDFMDAPYCQHDHDFICCNFVVESKIRCVKTWVSCVEIGIHQQCDAHKKSKHAMRSVWDAVHYIFHDWKICQMSFFSEVKILLNTATKGTTRKVSSAWRWWHIKLCEAAVRR